MLTACEECMRPFRSQGAGQTVKRFCSEVCARRARYKRNETRWLDNPEGTGGVIGALIESGEAIAIAIPSDKLGSGIDG